MPKNRENVHVHLTGKVTDLKSYQEVSGFDMLATVIFFIVVYLVEFV